ncbi:MAG: DUF3365 domain-containing protein [Deltaproteobacteria bacterium]|nr:DUF3365 domain-containing protein [Deltaproteobacteria bacterium]
MNRKDNQKRQTIPLRRYAWGLAVMWTLAVALSLIWNLIQENREVVSIARHIALTVLDRDILYRRWAASHGGVYVAVTPNSPPTPYLAHLPERDLKTPSGRRLTLLNPAYMTRQVYEFARTAHQVQGHLTSLKPIRPENAPDSWEKAALKSFEAGRSEVFSVVNITGQPHMRLMRPFITEQSCLVCHASQGYKVGDVRGGISVVVPMSELWVGKWESIFSWVLGHMVLWLLGLLGIVLGVRKLEQNAAETIKAQKAAAAAEKIRQLNEELERRVRDRTLQLEQANQELEGFSYSVSHDLRAPLRAINGFARILRENYADPLDREGLRLLGIISANSIKMSQLIDDLLAFARLGRHKLKIADLDMGALVSEVVAELREANPGRVMEWKIDSLPHAFGDHRVLRQVWVNLLANALKFTQRQEVAVIEVGYRQEGEETVFFVRDNGVGFDIKYAGKIFGVFQRLHGEEEFEGTGVGLALVERIISRHGGRVWAEGELNHGATFYFTLPLVKGKNHNLKGKVQ